MKLLNHSYSGYKELKKFITVNDVPNNNKVLIQLFTSGTSEEQLNEIYNEIKKLLPNTSIIGTSTAGVISGGKIFDNHVSISFSIFESSNTKTKSFKDVTEEEILVGLSKEINHETKLAIIFANTLTFNSTSLLKKLTKIYPKLAVVGGNAGDDFLFQRCYIFSDKSFDTDIAIALVDSRDLSVDTKHFLNWQKIGSELIVTKSSGSTVYELNNRPTIEIYRKYLGDEVANNPLKFGIEFPILFNEADVDVARAPVAFDKSSGSLTYAGDIPEGTKVKFGFANIPHIEQENQNDLIKEFKHYNEGVYIYSCAARRQALGTFLNKEISNLNKIAPTSGFITYGEFFHDQIYCNISFLNLSTTYVVLNEKKSTLKLELITKNIQKDKNEIRLKALTNFITQTGRELDENIHYLSQFKKCVDEATILSTTNKDGFITSINKNFVEISGYQEEELIGVYHNIIKHEDMPKELYQDMWQTISRGAMWKGIIKNKCKDGTAYYVLANISPIYNKDGTFKEYLSIRKNITELEEYKILLQSKLDTTNTTLQGKIHYTEQYEEAVNSSMAVIKTDTNSTITYANQKMMDLSGYDKDELIGMHCKNLRHQKYSTDKVFDKIKLNLAQKKHVHNILVNISKDGNEYTVSNFFVPIVDLENNVIEHLILMHDITEITKLTDEIIDTQKEVIFTLGAIGETRSQETGLHVKRVAEYSYILAKLYGLSEEEAELLKQASPIHDIGKVGIPDSILNKPGKLTQEEFEIMKTHASLGYEMLKYSKRDILKTSAIVANEHHEKWDGSGYPRGLQGEEIHIFGRITAIADVFDALGHDRVYKKAWDINMILELFKKEKGKHFDPKLIDLFMDNLDKFLEIKYTLK